MAVRKKLAHDAKTREKIRTSQLINRLESHVLGEVDLTSSQVTAALGLIRKTLPDLQATEMTAELLGDIKHSLVQVEFIGSDETTSR